MPRACASCSKLGQLLCDGCDLPLCARCSVSPREGVDFCPRCTHPLFSTWVKSPEGLRWESGASALKLNPEALRDLRRNVFRKWARGATWFESRRTAQSLEHGRPPFAALR